MINFMPRLLHFICHSRYAMIAFVACGLLTACGTGIEITERVTDKDVRRVVEKADARQPVVTIDAYADSLQAWKPGKLFWVADDQVKQLFAYQPGYDLDTLHLQGHVLRYVSHQTGGLFEDDNRYIKIALNDSVTGITYICNAGKATDAFRPGFSIPMLIDMDMVDHIARQVTGKDVFIRTPIWYDRDNGQMKDGRHYIKVHIDSVLPGNAVLPLRTYFTAVDSGERAMVWMSNNASTMHGRDFDALFVASDPHLAYPSITDENWERITRGQVIEGMTKEECRLALGAPKSIDERPEQAGMREFWYYDGGSYLYFVDGLLSHFRR